MLLDTQESGQLLGSHWMSDILENRTDDSSWQQKGGEGRGYLYGGREGKSVL